MSGNETGQEAWFETEALRQRLQLTAHVIDNAEAVVVVSAPPGGGRSTFLARLAAEAPETWRVCPIAGHETADAAGVVAALADCLGVAPEPAALRERVAALAGVGERVVVLADDADELDEAALAELAALGESGARLVLAGPPELAGRLEAGPMAELPRQHMPLPAFTEVEAVRFLRERLVRARREPPGDDAELRRAWAACKGLPGRLVAYLEASASLARPGGDGGQAPAAPARARPPGWAIAAAAAVVTLVLGGVAWWLVGGEPPGDGTVTEEVPLEVPPSPPPAAEGQATDTAVAEAPAEAEASAVALEPPERVAAAGSPEPAPAPSGAEAPAKAPAEVPAGAGPEPAEAPAAAAPAAGAGEGRGTPPAAAPAAEAAEGAERPAAKEAGPEQHATAPKPAGARAAAAPPAAAGGLLGPEWVLRQPPEAWTVQVLGASRREAVERFARTHRFPPGPLAWLETRRAGRPWFVLLHGRYPSREAARAAVRRLPAAVRRAGPWPRRLGELQRLAAARKAR
ncbi:MAG TPA: hypothetical protein ENK20_12995 [Chromatiales bacterium]|nr:hypothetical protein [Chromatiales bacterium]